MISTPRIPKSCNRDIQKRCHRRYFKRLVQAHVGHACEWTSVGILTVSDQEHLGCLPVELPASGCTHLRDGRVHGCWNPLPQRLYWWPRVRYEVPGAEGSQVGALGGFIGKSDAKTFIYSLCCSVEVPPTWVGFCLSCHPKHWAGVPPGGEGPGKLLPPNPFPGGHVQGPDTGNHPPNSTETGAGNPQTNYVGLGKLDVLLCHHRTPGRSSPRHNRVQVRVSRPASSGGTRVNTAPPCDQHTRGSGGGHDISPQTGYMSTDIGNQNGGGGSLYSHPKWIKRRWGIRSVKMPYSFAME